MESQIDEDRLQPYESQLVALSEQMRASDDDPYASQERAPLEEVADAVLQAVEAEHVSLRTLIGEDAETLVALRQQLSADQYDLEIRKRAGLTDS